MAVIAKLNMADGFPGGLGSTRASRSPRLLEADGALDALELTGGGSFKNPMYLFRGDAPDRGDGRGDPAARAHRAQAPGQAVPARRTRSRRPTSCPTPASSGRRCDLPLVLLGGINRLETVRTALAEGFEFVAMGRALLREPDLLSRWQGGDAARGSCDPLQQVHADDLPGHPLRARPRGGAARAGPEPR